VIGPLCINGLHASGDFFAPLVATEAAPIASFARRRHHQPGRGASASCRPH
jgi:hydroxymethylglutaryl-CoA reductase